MADAVPTSAPVESSRLVGLGTRWVMILDSCFLRNVMSSTERQKGVRFDLSLIHIWAYESDTICVGSV
jgi:hypothetical protein